MDFTDQKEFEMFLKEEHGFEDRVVPWMARWVGGFLKGLESFAYWDQRCREYYQELELRVAGWRYAQAAKSIQLYWSFHRRTIQDVPSTVYSGDFGQ